MADLPSILGGMAQGFIDFGKGAVDLFGTGGAAIGDLVDTIRTGKVTTKNQDDFRKWLYQTDSTKDAAAKGLGTALNGVQTVADYIPGVNVLTRNPLGNAAQGALGGLADEFKTYGENYDLGRAGQRAAVSAAGAAASGSLADALKGSSNALLSSNTLQGLARGATGGAISGGGYAAIDGGDVLEAAKQGAGMGALIGGATGLAQDFKPAKTYDMALTDSERQARLANIDDQLSKLDTSTPEGNARYNELMNARDNYLPTARALETTLSDADMAVNNPRYLTDENGNPRTFYHGSPNKNITEFDINKAGKNTRSGERALYFTDSPEVADEFSYERIPTDDLFLENRGEKGRVYPVNLEMNNPLDLDNLTDAQIRELWDYASPMGQLDGQEKFIKNLTNWRDNTHNAQLTKGYLDLDKLRNSQYDGFTARMYPNQANQAREYAVFDNSKVKMLEDVLANDDMAVNNPKLTPEQEAYFKDSVIRDENGNLMPMYHGTRGNFTVFGDNAPSDTSNSHASVGNWFTPTKEGAKNFAESIWYGDGDPKVMETYLNVKNPKIYETVDNSKAVEALTKELREMELNSSKLSDTELYSKNIYDASMAQRMLEQEGRDTTIKWLSGKGYGDEKAAKLVDEIAGLNEQAAKKKDLLDRLSELKYSDAYQRFKTDIYKMDGQTAEDANVGGTGMALNDRGSIKKYVDKLKSEGYDGIIIKGTRYDADTMGGPNDQYVVFDSNQIKDINNLRPTSDVDIMAEIIPEDMDLGRTLSRQDLSVNSAKIAPGQLGLFDNMPTQTPKTGTRQTSLFDQPDNPYLDYYGADIDATPLAPEAPANPYAPVNGEVTQAMRDRASEIIDNLALKKQIPDNELFNKIDPATLPKGQQKIGEFLDQAYAKGLTHGDITDMMRETVSSEFDKRLGKAPDKEKLISFIFGNADDTAKKEMMDRELGLYIAPETVSESTLKSMAKHKISSEIYGDNLSALVAGNRTLRGGYTGALDSVLSERLGIAPGNTYKKTGEYDANGSYGRYEEYKYNPNKNNIMVRTALNNEDAINTMAHERLHSFQTEAKKLYDKDRYSPEVKDAYDELAKDLKTAKAYRTGDEIKKRYGRGVAYWRNHDEQEARMLQQYLDAKGFTDSKHHNERQYLGLEFDDAKITPAFDKFFDKLRDLSKRGVALPALAALFGGGAYMASQENDKEKEVK